MAIIILTGRFGGWFGKLGQGFQDVTGQTANQSIELKPLSNAELAEIMNQRWKANDHLLRGDDLVKFSFFQSGENAGRSVCCLTRRFTQAEDLDLLIKAAKEEAHKGRTRLKSLLLECYGIDPLQDETGFRTKAQAVDLPYASGFLVGGDYLLTNRHVVVKKELLGEFKAVFGYEAASSNGKSDLELLEQAQKYTFDEDFWVTSVEDSPLDYVLLKLKPLDGKSVSVNFQPLDLRPVADTLNGKVAPSLTQQNLNNMPDLAGLKALLNSDLVKHIETETPNMVNGDPIHMIEHPGGRPKEIVVFNNRLIRAHQDFLEYQTDAEPGSSGSPLFNTDWQVVGLHQSALLDEAKLKATSPQQVITSYLGIRIDRIIADLRAKPEAQEFLKHYVDHPTESTAKPQVFVLAGRNRSFLGDDAHLELGSMLNLRQALKAQIEDSTSSIQMVEIDGRPELGSLEASKQSIQEINQKIHSDYLTDPQRRQIAIELLTNRSSSPSQSHGITLFYSAADAKAQQVAIAFQASLQSFGNQHGSPLPYIAALPDTYTSTQRLGFCRDVNIPSVVIYVGYLDNDSDRTFLETIQADLSAANTLAKAIADGILTYLNSTEDTLN
ncbi:MAG: trypsin-like peptidase domain-containing protein [Leptolyngbyaceae cyanobacterium]